MKQSQADIICEYGPFPGTDAVHGVTYDGRNVWFATGDRLIALDPDHPESGRSLDIVANAGTAYDGQYLYQIAEDSIQKVDPESGQVLATIKAPGESISGMAWAEGSLWVGGYRSRTIHQLDPQSGTVLKTIESDRFVTGVTWVGGELWHGCWENDESELRRIDPATGEALESIKMPTGTGISGLESDGGDRFFCGGGKSGTIRVVRHPGRGASRNPH